MARPDEGRREYVHVSSAAAVLAADAPVMPHHGALAQLGGIPQRGSSRVSK
ncbi:MAG: hypothetical protein L0H83_15715 [Salinisphaera sp.]|nr:hypothetical protein [Salinisphaera sp.]